MCSRRAFQLLTQLGPRPRKPCIVLAPPIGGWDAPAMASVHSEQVRSARKTLRRAYGRLSLRWTDSGRGRFNMRRREFITLLVGGAAAWPPPARGQQPLPTIGFLSPTSADTNAEYLRAFRQALAQTGYIEGRSVAIEYRWAGNQMDRLPTLAADLVRLRVAVIVAGAQPAAFAAKAVTTTIPVVFILSDDPVRLGLVTSIARPAGNLTGVNFLNVEMTAKRLELLRALVPEALRFAVLVNPTNPNAETIVRDVEAAARAMRLQIRVHKAGTIGEIDAAFATFRREQPDALFVATDPFFRARRVQLARFWRRITESLRPMRFVTMPKPVG